MKLTVLVIDDERSVRKSLTTVLDDAGFQVETAASVAEGRECLATGRPDLVIIDMKLPDGDGVELLAEAVAVEPAPESIVITAYGDVDAAVGAMKAGAGDFLKKPYGLDELLHAVQAAAERVAHKRQLDGYRRRDWQSYRAERLIGECAAMEAVRAVVDKVAASDATSVLIEGESGTGKELVARSIHYQSQRADYPLMEVNCSNFQETTLENELFGHERGAFTDARDLKKGLVELCDQGTLFLDEVAEMSAPTQAKLLRFIDRKTFKRVGGTKELSVDLRIVAATNKRLADCVKEGSFREDLYYRLKVVSIEMPPLRERGNDILSLTDHFLDMFNRKFKRHFTRLSDDAKALLSAYPWPGNVRELKNVMERVVLLEDAGEVRASMLPRDIVLGVDALAEHMLPLAQVEEDYIRRVLRATAWNKSKAARILGISRQSLLDRLKRYDVVEQNPSQSTAARESHRVRV